MANLKNIPADHLRDVLSQVNDGDATIRVVAILLFVEVDEFSQNRVAEMLGFSGGWSSNCLDDSNGSPWV